MKKGDCAALAMSGAEFAVRVTPRARQASVTLTEGLWRISVTAAPEDGKANAAVAEALAHALGVAKTRLTLLRGATSRDKIFRLEP
jgi:uncharacterized protein YggU (UPF0235/DUF167 family)